MREVMTNLLNNAIDAVTFGGRVEISTGRRNNGWPYVSVADNGPGRIGRQPAPPVRAALHYQGRRHRPRPLHVIRHRPGTPGPADVRGWPPRRRLHGVAASVQPVSAA